MKNSGKMLYDGFKVAAVFLIGFAVGEVIGRKVSEKLLGKNWANWYDDGYFDGMEVAFNLCSQ